jgi:arylsulfatase A-like enzyme
VPDPTAPESQPSRLATLCCLLAAGALAGFVEIAFFLPTGAAVPPGDLLHHLVRLVAIYAIVGTMVAAVSENALALALLLGPSLIAASPFLIRRFSFASVIVIVVVALVAARRWRSSRTTSLLLAAGLGAFLGGRTASFFTRHWDGVNTALTPVLLLLGATVFVLGAHAVGTLAGSRRRLGPAASLSVAAAVTLGGLGLSLVGNAGLPSVIEGAATFDEAPPVVVIVLDAVRADHLADYGYPHDTMPKLGEFARSEAILYERAISNAPDSLASHASLFTGLYPTGHGAHRPLLSDENPPVFAYPLRQDVPTLASALGEFGYATAAVSGNFGPLGPGFGLDRGFDVYHAIPDGACEFGRRSAWRPAAIALSSLSGRSGSSAPWRLDCERRYRRAASIVDDAIALVDAAADSAFFLFVNLFDAHAPYSPPAEYRDRFPPSGDSAAPEVPLYDGELAYVDDQLDRLLRALRRHPAWDRMLVVITADHGEAFGEHGLWDHSTSLYDEMIRVPMIIRPPSVAGDDIAPGTRSERPLQLVDIMPITLAHAGVEHTLDLDGRPLDVEAQPLRSWSFVSQAKIEEMPELRRELRSIEAHGFKLIEAFPGSPELYDLIADPKERTNVAGERPGVRDELLALLGDRGESYRALFGAGEVGDPEALERLRALGYIR